MKLFLTLCLLFLASLENFGQKKLKESIFNPELVWGEGSILLNDGSELKGLVRYNDKDNVLSYQSGDQSGSYTSRHVRHFEFFDERTNKQRIFYSFPFEDPQNNVERNLFF
jgi:hypothetical protein